jgi:hypothetical protein
MGEARATTSVPECPGGFRPSASLVTHGGAGTGSNRPEIVAATGAASSSLR